MSTLRIDLLAPPMAGHLHPVLGIAARLAREPDVAVRVLSTAAAQQQVAACGLDGVTLLPGADHLIDTVVNPPYRVGSSPRLLRRQLRGTVTLQRDLRRALLERWARPGERPDLVIADFTMVGAGTAATTLGVPWWTSHPSPCVIEARSGPPAYLGGLRPGTGRLGRARDAAARRLVRATKRTFPRWSGVRLADAGVERMYRPDGSETIYSPDVVLALTPPQVEYARDLPAAVVAVGPVLLTPPATTEPPALEPGRRHVLLTAGTHLAWHKKALLDAAVRAAEQLAHRDAGRFADVRLHLSLGGEAPDDLRAGRHAGVVVHHTVSYARDLARFEAVVHHGGSGVLGHTLAAGLPAVVWPVDYDQLDHAVRLVDAGVAVGMRRGDELADAVVRALTSPELRRTAGEVAAAIAAHPADDAVAELVRRWRTDRDARQAPPRPDTGTGDAREPGGGRMGAW